MRFPERVTGEADDGSRRRCAGPCGDAGLSDPQFDIAWSPTQYHLDGLTTEECLWRPAAQRLHVHQDADGTWRADWPEHEGYDLGPPSIAWVTWHLGFWWSMVLDHSPAGGTLTREAVLWPGDADSVRAWIDGLQALAGDARGAHGR